MIGGASGAIRSASSTGQPVRGRQFPAFAPEQDEIEQDEVRPLVQGKVHSLLGGVRFDDLAVRIGELDFVLQAVSDERVIVDNQ